MVGSTKKNSLSQTPYIGCFLKFRYLRGVLYQGVLQAVDVKKKALVLVNVHHLGTDEHSQRQIVGKGLLCEKRCTFYVEYISDLEVMEPTVNDDNEGKLDM